MYTLDKKNDCRGATALDILLIALVCTLIFTAAVFVAGRLASPEIKGAPLAMLTDYAAKPAPAASPQGRYEGMTTHNGRRLQVVYEFLPAGVIVKRITGEDLLMVFSAEYVISGSLLLYRNAHDYRVFPYAGEPFEMADQNTLVLPAGFGVVNNLVLPDNFGVAAGSLRLERR